MKSTIDVQLRVSEIFQFEDGRTIFVGFFDGNSNYIRPCQATMWQDGRVLRSLSIEGEMLTNSKRTDGLRAVSTKDDLKGLSLTPMEHEIVLHLGT